MECGACGFKNREGANFCSECGNKLESRCSNCDNVNSASAKFCDSCGNSLKKQPLTNPIPADPPATVSVRKVAAARNPNDPPALSRASPVQPEVSTASGAANFSAKNHDTNPADGTTESQFDQQIDHAAERRQLTVVFCDLVGSTEMSQRVDAEEMRQLLGGYQAMVRGVIDRYAGLVARYIGDGILIYFGYPIAYEDSTERALNAALEIASSTPGLAKSSGVPDIEMQVRIGINTGSVVVGDIGTGGAREHMAAVGDVPNIAARIQACADPGEVLIGKSTRAIVADKFEFESLGDHSLKGISQPIELFKLLKAADEHSKIEASIRRFSSTVIGRDAELALFSNRMERVLDGDGQALLISGEAGIGKSHVVQRFRETQTDTPLRELAIYASAQHLSSVFFPIINMLEREIGFDSNDDITTRRIKLESHLERCGQSDQIQIYAWLLDLKIFDTEISSTMAPDQLKARAMHCLTDYFKSITRQVPLVLIVEDVHWADPSTLELINSWMDQLHTVRCLTILTFRPEFEPSWPHRDHLSALELSRLSRTETKTMVTRLTEKKPLPDEVMNQIIRKTDGVPLFVEELTKMVINSGLLVEEADQYVLKGHLPSLAIPESLQDSLMARLDQLSSVKEIAQLASTLGRNFSHSLLEAASQMPTAEFETAIDTLLDAELIFKSGQPPDVQYEFKHALVQETAYNNLLNATRIQYHRRFALLLARDFPESVAKNPESLAYHYSKASMPKEAIPYWLQAGDIAMNRSANIEAVAEFEQALKDIAKLTDGQGKDEQELGVQIKLAVPQTSLHGYASSVVEKTYTRARHLSRKVGHIRLLFPSIYGMWRFYLLGAQYSMADELSRELVMLSNQTDDPVFETAAHRSRGATLFYMGHLVEARDHLEKVVNTPPSEADRTRALSYDVVDAVVASHAYLSWTLWLLGYPDAARRESNNAVAAAHSIEHQFSIALANCFGSWTHQFCRDELLTKQTASDALNLSTDKTFRFWIGWARIMEAWAEKDQLSPQTRLENSNRGMEEWLSTGSRLGQSYFLQLLASIPGAKQSANHNQHLVDALAFCDESREQFWQAEILRVKGEQLLLAGPSNFTAIEKNYKEALDLAKQQGALSLQLRIAMSHYRLMIEFGGIEDQVKSKSVLSEVFATFSEGYDTRDLIEAEELLTRNTPHSPQGPENTLLS